MGWKGPLVPNGVFPEVDGDTAAVEKSKMIGEMDAAFSWGNYKSFHEAGEHAKAEVKRVVDSGFAQVFDDWEEATATLGDDVVVNRLGCVVKTKANGEIKARLVTDLRRSGGNGRCKVRERIVLPRVLDLVHSVLRMLRHWGCTSFVELVAIDFSDAFHTLFLQQQERPLCMFEADGKVHCYNRLPFGLASAPLLWGRLAAAGFRICQSTARVHEFDAHCYVDDPGLVVAGGSTHTRRRSLATLLLLLLILGFDISWTKAQHGQKIEWLGVCVELTWHEDRPAVRVSIPATKIEDMLREIEEVLGGGNLTDVKKLRRIAGRVGWLAGFIPWARAFASALYAVLTEEIPHGRRRTKRPDNFRFVKQAETALRWTKRLLEGDVQAADGRAVPLVRIFSVKEAAASQFTVRCDASPWGFGGILEKHGRPIAWWACGISPEDRRVIPGELGDPAYQAEWELFAILISFVTWGESLCGGTVACVETDSKAAMYATAKLSSNTPTMNALAGEIGLRLVGRCVDLKHISGVSNYEADALSRLYVGKDVPEHLRAVPRSVPPARNADFFLAWPRELV